MYLEWLDIEGEVVRLLLDPKMEPATIGRTPQCSIYSKETSVSRNHGKIGWDSDGYYIKDLGSSNGTFINGERQQRGILREGDVARCGEVLEIRVVGGDLPNPKKKTLQLEDNKSRGNANVAKSEREALVAAARAARTGQSPDAQRTDARNAEPAAAMASPPRELPRPAAPLSVPPSRQPTPERPVPAFEVDVTARPPTLREVAEQTHRLNVAEQKAAAAERELAEVRAALVQAETSAKAVGGRSNRYEIELEGLTDKYANLKEHNQKLSGELERTRRDLRHAEDAANEAERAAKDLAGQIDQAREKAAEATELLSGLKVRITQKDRQIEELQRQLDLLEYDLRSARDENESLQSSFNREGGDLSRLERKLNLLQEVLQEKEALIEQLRLDLRQKDVEIRQVRMGVGISDLEHEKRRLLEDYHLATRRVDELNDRMLAQTKQAEELRAEVDAARQAVERKPAVLADVTDHPDYKLKLRELDRTQEKLDLALADVARLEAKVSATPILPVVPKVIPATPPPSPAVLEGLEGLHDAADASRSNAAVVRRYMEDLVAGTHVTPELKETLELIHDIAQVLAQDLGEQARSIEMLKRLLQPESETP